MFDKLKESIESSPVVMKKGYPYVAMPLTDGNRMDPGIMRWVLSRMLEIGDFDCDLILTPEAMGIPLAVPLALEKGLPYAVIRGSTAWRTR